MRAFVASDNETIAAKLREVLLRNTLDCPATHVVKLDVAADWSVRVRPDLIVVVLSSESERGLMLLREIHNTSHAHLVAVGPANDPKLILRALRHGAHEYLDESDLENELTNALQRLRATRSPYGEPGRVITVLAPSGGSGSSTLAVNVATVLAQTHKGTGLVDLKLEAGDLAALLDLKPAHTLADLCRNLSRLDRSMFEKLLVQHSSGVHLLAAPRTFADIAQVTTKGVRQALIMAKALFPFVVVDMDHNVRDEQVEALAHADIVLLVLRLDFISLRNSRRVLDHLEQMGIGSERVRLVVNRHRQPKELSARRAEDALGMRLAHFVPDDPKNVNRANNRGIPVVLDRPSAKVSRSMVDLAASVNGLYVPGGSAS